MSYLFDSRRLKLTEKNVDGRGFMTGGSADTVALHVRNYI